MNLIRLLNRPCHIIVLDYALEMIYFLLAQRFGMMYDRIYRESLIKGKQEIEGELKFCPRINSYSRKFPLRSS